MIKTQESVKKRIQKKRVITLKFKKVIKELEPPIRFLALHNRFFVQFFCRFFLKTYFPLTVVGRENLPQDESFIMVSNHSSHIDTGVLGVASNLDFNRLAMLAAKDYWFENKIRRFVIYFFFNLIPIERKIRRDRRQRSAFRLTVNFCKKFLTCDRSAIILYPEGTRTKNGEIQEFKNGASKLAIELQVPMVPVYLKGTYQALSRHDWFPKPTRILAVIGKPLYPSPKHKNTSSKELLQSYQVFIDEVRKAIIDLKKKHVSKH